MRRLRQAIGVLVLRICFVGHERYRRAGPARFVIELLRTVADVTEIHGDPDGSSDVDDAVARQLVGSRFDRYVYWQSERLLDRLLPMDLGPSFLAPMYDTAADIADAWWLRFVNCHFLSFTRVHHERLRAMGCTSSHFQFFPDPGLKRERQFYGDRDAFWPRQTHGGVDLHDVVRQCRALGIERLHIHEASDAPEDARTPPFMGDGALQVTVSRGFSQAETYRSLASEPLFFIAPHVREGAGTACLEAMARSQIVVAPDRAAVNEYVSHRCSGFLYPPGFTDVPLLPINAAGLARISRAARRKAVEGRLAWLADAERLLSIVAMDGRRWSTSDSSAGFGTAIRREAHRRLQGGR